MLVDRIAGFKPRCRLEGRFELLLVVLLGFLACCGAKEQLSRSVQVSSTSELQKALDLLLSEADGSQTARLAVSGRHGGRIMIDAPLSVSSHWAAGLHIVGRAQRDRGSRTVLACSSKPIQGLALRRAHAAGASVLSIASGANVTLQGFAVLGCNATVPPVLVGDAATALLVDVELSNNTNMGASEESDGGNGAGVVCDSCAQLLLERVDARHNLATSRGGVLFVRGAERRVVVRDSQFVLNAAKVDGGSMSVEDADVLLERVLFNGSHCKTEHGWSCSGGALAVRSTTGDAATLHARHVTITNCSAGFEGAGIRLEDAAAYLDSLTCVGSSTVESGGGCLYSAVNLAGAPDLRLTNCTIEDNVASYVGGGIGVYSGHVLIRNCSISNNQVIGDGSYGGGIHFEGNGSLTIEDSVIVNNSASFQGGGVSAARHIATFSAVNVTLDKNRAGDAGGAVHCDNISCHLHNCSIDANSAAVAGGISSSNSPSVRITQCNITRNKAKSAAGMRHISAVKLFVADSTIADNEAGLDSGGVFITQCHDTVFAHTRFTQNKAAYGAGLASYLCRSVGISNSSFEANHAVASVAGVRGQGVQVFLTDVGDLVVAGRGAGISADQVNLTLRGVSLTGNLADVSAGGLLLQQGRLVADGSSWRGNRAGDGPGGGLFAASGSRVVLSGAQFAANSGSSGGALMITHGGHQPVDVMLKDVSFEGNAAVAGTGGGISATGLLSLHLTRCSFTNNSANGSGGGLFCQNCQALNLTDSSASDNTATGSGGAFCCLNCTQLLAERLAAADNSAGEGAAVTASGLTALSTIRHSSFSGNTAAAAPAADGGEEPPAWQAVCAGTAGGGGAICLQHCARVSVSDSSLVGNTARTGGAVFQAGCGGRPLAKAGAAGGPADAVDYTGVGFDNNTADGGGGAAIYTTDAALLQFGGAAPSDALIQRLAANNSAAAYGRGIASGADGLVIASNWSRVELRAEATGRRTLLQLEGSSSSVGSSSGALQVESSKLSILNVKVLDAYGSIVSVIGEEAALTIRLSAAHLASVPGQAATNAAARQADGSSSTSSSSGSSAQCAQQCVPAAGSSPGTAGPASGSTCFTGCLSGATTVVFGQGVAVFDSLRFQAPPNTSWLLHLLPLQIVGLAPLQVPVEVMHCGAGELTSPADTMSCQPCLSYQYSFNPAAGCASCPQPGGSCTNGLLTPLPGYWQSHPRSNQLHRCPHVAACTPASPAALLGFQRQHRYELDSVTDLATYMQRQCADGYEGRLCDACHRQAGFGSGPGRRCTACPGGVAASLVAFLLVRLVDVAAVAALVVLWGQAAAEAVAGGAASEVDAAGGRVRARVGRLSFWQFFSMVYLTWSQLAALILNGSAAAWHLQPWASGLLSGLLVTPQSTWHWVGLECLMGSGWNSSASPGLIRTILAITYPVFLVPAGMLLAPLLARALQAGRAWRMAAADAPVPPGVVPILAARSASDGAPASVAMTAESVAGASRTSSPLPGALDSRPSSMASGLLDTAAASKDAQLPGWPAASSQPLLQPRLQPGVPLFTLALLVSISFCFSSICHATVGAFWCVHLDSPVHGSDQVAGVVLAALGRYWVADLEQTCGAPQHVAAAAVGALLGLPAVVGLLVWCLAAAAAFRMSLQHKPAAPTAAAATATPAAVLAAALMDKAGSFKSSSSTSSQRPLVRQQAGDAARGSTALQRLLGSPLQVAVGALCARLLRPAVWWWSCVDLLGRLLVAVVVVMTALSPQHAVQALSIQAAVSLLQMAHLLCQPEADARCRYVGVVCHCLLQAIAIVFVAISAGASIAGAGWDARAASIIFGLCGVGCALAFVVVVAVAARRCSATTLQDDLLGWRGPKGGRQVASLMKDRQSLEKPA